MGGQTTPKQQSAGKHTKRTTESELAFLPELKKNQKPKKTKNQNQKTQNGPDSAPADARPRRHPGLGRDLLGLILDFLRSADLQPRSRVPSTSAVTVPQADRVSRVLVPQQPLRPVLARPCMGVGLTAPEIGWQSRPAVPSEGWMCPPENRSPTAYNSGVGSPISFYCTVFLTWCTEVCIFFFFFAPERAYLTHV